MDSIASYITLIYEKTTKAMLNIQGLIYNYGFRCRINALITCFVCPFKRRTGLERYPRPLFSKYAGLSFENNTNAAKVAMNNLKALINHVEAQIDKKITPAAAAEIIQQTNAIMAALSN